MEKTGSITKVMRHRKGKSSSKPKNTQKNVNIHVSNRFAALENITELDGDSPEIFSKMYRNKNSHDCRRSET